MSSKEEKYGEFGVLQLFSFKTLKDFTFEFYKTQLIYLYVSTYVCITLLLSQLTINWMTSFGNLKKNGSRGKIVLQ